MTLKNIAENTMKLLEEFSESQKWNTDDADIRNKFLIAYNNIANEISKVYGIKDMREFDTPLNLITAKIKNVVEVKKDGKPYYGWYLENGFLKTKDEGTFTLYYDKRPNILTEDDEVIEFPDEVANVMPFGIARLLLIGEDEYNRANEFEQKYYQLVQEIPKTSGFTKARINGYGTVRR